MPEKSKTVELTVSVSFPEGFSESFSDLISRRALDFATIISDEFLRNLVACPRDKSAGLTGNLIISPRLSISDFDAKISAALRAFRRELQVP